MSMKKVLLGPILLSGSMIIGQINDKTNTVTNSVRNIMGNPTSIVVSVAYIMATDEVVS